MNDDLALLRRYEPIARYTYGEHFFPIDVDRYVERAGLWLRPRYAPATELIPRGSLRLNRLTNPLPGGDPEGLLFLQFIEPLSGRALQKILSRRDRPHFHARGRLARVGLTARIADALFTITLLLRGTVPGGTEAAAEEAYNAILAEGERYTYYGRVLHENGYIVLHYLYFYCMNDWRSSFHGVNDHEGDWEQVFVYLQENGESPEPVWIAYASHDYSGDDLRRRWDDPEVEKVGSHPVIYCGAGSHASYFSRGEYLVTVSLSALRPLIRVLETIQRFWRVTLRQGDPDAQPTDIAELFRIPFVDYARGDGLSIGPGGDQAWTAVLLEDPPPAWVTQYRGLWGFYARDPVSGENAPAGPKFNRDGTVRRSWHNPLGWAGLLKVDPPARQEDVLQARLSELDAQQVTDRAAAEEQRTALARLYVEYRALADQPHLRQSYKDVWARVQEGESALNTLYDTIAARDEIIQSCQRELAQVRAGDTGPMRDHIRHAHAPQSEEEIRVSRLAESWAAFSAGLLLVGFVLLYLTADRWIIGLGMLLVSFLLLEAIFRREIERIIVRGTLAISIFAALLLIYDFFWEIIAGAILAVGLMIIADNLRELRE